MNKDSKDNVHETIKPPPITLPSQDQQKKQDNVKTNDFNPIPSENKFSLKGQSINLINFFNFF